MQSTLIKLSSSLALFYISNKGSKILVQKFSKYPFFTNYVVPFGYIGGVYTAKTILNEIISPSGVGGFVGYLIDGYIMAHTVNYWISILGLIGGYTGTTLIINYCINKIKKNSVSLTINNQPAVEFVNNVMQNMNRIWKEMKESLSKNENWDVVYEGLSLRTFSAPKKFPSREELESKFPLRCASISPSESKYLDSCNICLESINNKKLHRELTCNHVFHPECVDEWLLKCNSTCPTCKAKV